MTFGEKCEWIMESDRIGIITRDQAIDQITEAYDLYKEIDIHFGKEDVFIRFPNGSCGRCECGCNVFKKGIENKNAFRCNACGAILEGI